MKELPVLQF